MKTILVIEDKTEVRENVVEMLELAQYVVLAAADGKKGVELARSASPDLILCDIMMPELDGYGVLHILSKDPLTATIPFIFLTAKIDPAHFRSGMNLGADDYLTKPVDDITLLNAVEIRLKKNEQARRKADFTGLTTLLSAVHNPDEANQHLGTRYPTIHYVKKQLLFGEGNSPSALYFIRRGQLKRFKTDVMGNALITALVGEGDFVGLTALLTETTYGESAEVLADADVCVIPKGEFFALLENHADIAAYFIGLLAEEVAQRDDRLLKLAYQPVRKRVADALLMVHRKFYSRSEGRTPGGPARSDSSGASTGSNDPVWSDSRTPNSQMWSGRTSGGLESGGSTNASQTSDSVNKHESPENNRLASAQYPPITLSRENWSQLVGASTETVIRALSDLRLEGLIDLTGSQITILNVDRLARLKH